MALLQTIESKGKKKITVHVSEIRPNENNFYPMVEIEDLANQIYSMKEQMHPGEAYIEDKGDGKRFTLTDGERRMLAITMLHEQKKHDGMMDLFIIPKPKNIWEERRRIRTANIHRPDSPLIIMQEVKQLLDEYEYLVSIGQKPAGLKRDWIAKDLGKSGRTIERYLEKIKSLNEDEKGNQKKEVEKDESAFVEEIQAKIQNRLNRKTVITKSELKIKYTDLNDLNRILNELNLIDTET